MSCILNKTKTRGKVHEFVLFNKTMQNQITLGTQNDVRNVTIFTSELVEGFVFMVR